MVPVRDTIIQLISIERERQIERWGRQIHPAGFWLLILIEELGEVSEAMLIGNRTSGAEELVHAAAVLVAWLENILETDGSGAELLNRARRPSSEFDKEAT